MDLGNAMKHLNDKDVASGLMFIGVGTICLFLMGGFEFGTSARPGPGFFPIVLSVLLIVIGVAVSGWGLLRQAGPLAEIAPRPLILITSAVCIFALCIEPFGLVPSIILATFIATFARPNYGLLQRSLLAVSLAAVSAILFVVALNLPIALWSI